MNNSFGEFDRDASWRGRAHRHLLQSAEIQRQAAKQCMDSILVATRLISESFREGNKILLCGNGGSAADAQHVAAELVCRLTKDFKRPGLPAIALTTDTSFLTAFANDYGFEGVFERQVRALARPGDVLIAISTSGNSKNVVRAVKAAKEVGLSTVGLLGEGGILTKLVECAIVVPSRNTLYIQECLMSIEHILCDLIERILFTEEETQ
jgi:D-sedoheptulose 7-phosphate isomerase